jgi:hypothetical protein
MRAMPPASSSTAMAGAMTSAAGTPILAKDAWVPAMVHSLNFCHPWAANRKPRMMRRAARAVVVSRDWFMDTTLPS